MKNVRYFSLLFCASLFLYSCSFYQVKNAEIQAFISDGDAKSAYEVISTKEKKWDKGNNKMLYYLNRGTLAWMLNKTEESTKYFLKADDYIDNFSRNYGSEALAMLTNDKARPYIPEEHEKLIFHYYLALNYLQIGKYEDAMVECRRMNLQLNRLDNKFKNDKEGGTGNKYQRDAFIHNFMGLVYDASGEYNDAYIAYKNAVEVYETDYKENFGLGVPEQLKKDLLRTAYFSRLDDEVRRYEKKFDMKFVRKTKNTGDLLFFWNNGLGPVKAEKSINFSIIRGVGGYVTLTNEALGYSFPIFIGESNTATDAPFSAVEFIRMAYPTYRSREPIYSSATLKTKEGSHAFEMIEDVNKVANKALKDKIDKIILKSLTRLVLKKVAEYTLRSEDETAGALLGIANAITEQADNRNWQTLPHSIHYARVSLPEGTHEVEFLPKLKLYSNIDPKGEKFTFKIFNNRATVHSYQTLESLKLR